MFFNYLFITERQLWSHDTLLIFQELREVVPVPSISRRKDGGLVTLGIEPLPSSLEPDYSGPISGALSFLSANGPVGCIDFCDAEWPLLSFQGVGQALIVSLPPVNQCIGADRCSVVAISFRANPKEWLSVLGDEDFRRTIAKTAACLRCYYGFGCRSESAPVSSGYHMIETHGRLVIDVDIHVITHFQFESTVLSQWFMANYRDKLPETMPNPSVEAAVKGWSIAAYFPERPVLRVSANES